jgi:FkbM family methyltransferase
MGQRLVDSVKSVFSSLGLFVARQYPDVVHGYRLEDDLKLIIPRTDPLCFDIGANRGQTIQMLQHCFARPIIHAFEPSATTYETLANQSYGPRVTLHQLAMGEQAGVAEFRNYEQSELSSFLAVNPDKGENLFATQELLSVETVRVETLDDFCGAQKIDYIDLLKIDTQGFELPVLRGGDNLFRQKKVGAVLLELNFATLYEGQSDFLEILQWMRSYNMRLVDYYEKERVLSQALSWTTALFMRYD